MATRPNVILIIADQMRADCLGADGHPVARTAGDCGWVENGGPASPPPAEPLVSPFRDTRYLGGPKE